MINLTCKPLLKTYINEEYYDIRFNIKNYNICCGTFVKCLKLKLGGIIYGICEKTELSFPCHYVLLTDKFIDCTGIYSDEISMIKIVKSRYENELDHDLICYECGDDLNNIDYECDLDNKEILNIVDYVLSILNH